MSKTFMIWLIRKSKANNRLKILRNNKSENMKFMDQNYLMVKNLRILMKIL